MSSKLLKPGSEMKGKSKGDKDLGLKAKWGGSAMGPDKIASVSGYNEGMAAPLRAGNSRITKSVGKDSPPHGYSGGVMGKL